MYFQPSASLQPHKSQQPQTLFPNAFGRVLAEAYDAARNNCNHFTDRVSMYLAWR